MEDPAAIAEVVDADLFVGEGVSDSRGGLGGVRDGDHDRRGPVTGRLPLFLLLLPIEAEEVVSGVEESWEWFGLFGALVVEVIIDIGIGVDMVEPGPVII